MNAHSHDAKQFSSSSPIQDVSNEASRDESAIAYDSEDLFKHHREISIMHHGTRYRLRITAAGKLLLTK